MIPNDHSVGVYLHIPFCDRICPYCDFAVVAARPLEPAREARYVDALLAELALRTPDFAGRRLATLYFGGGTPSLLQPDSVARLVEAVHDAFPGERAEEVTLEVNPGHVERERLPGFRAAGVDRLSIGIQSFDDTALRRLGRAHKAEEGHRALAAAREAGFQNLSLDLIFAAPDQSAADLERDLAAAVAFAPEHVSAYELTIEPDTPFGEAAARGRLSRPGEEGAAAMLERVCSALGAAGLTRYEVSSYARPGFESRHNTRYWRRAPVLGLGMGAASCDPPGSGAPHGVRRQNPRQLEAYLSGVERVEGVASGVPEPAECEVLEAAQARGEAAFLALRRVAGLECAGFAAEFGAPPRAFWQAAIEELCAAGLLAESPAGDLALTSRGFLLSDSVFERFV